jgi:tripartite-type tricarboxylate transporter receptor subunit TctC
MLAFARANPGKLNWGSSGSGGPQHLTGLQFIKLTQLSMVHVPYRGNGPMIAALNSNEIQVAFDTQTLVVPQIEAGRLVPLALASDRRAARLPQVPTFREAGIDLAIQITNFVLAPKGLPAPIQAVLNREFAAALADPSVRARLEALGHTVPLPAENTPQAVRQHIDMFQSTYSALIIEMGIKAE